jgi:Tfp pilus assembly protein PilE
MRQRGIMIVELLLVISVAVIILFLGLERYRAYYQSMQFDLVKDDLVTIRQDLNQYYNSIPCDTDGVMQEDVGTDIIDKLNTITARSPYIDHYHAYIEQSGEQTKEKKPVYNFVITADVDGKYQNIFDYLTSRLNGARHDDKSIYWTVLPNTTTVQPKSVLWVMNVSRNQFKNLKNDETLGVGQLSHSYCFR